MLHAINEGIPSGGIWLNVQYWNSKWVSCHKWILWVHVYLQGKNILFKLISTKNWFSEMNGSLGAVGSEENGRILAESVQLWILPSNLLYKNLNCSSRESIYLWTQPGGFFLLAQMQWRIQQLATYGWCQQVQSVDYIAAGSRGYSFVWMIWVQNLLILFSCYLRHPLFWMLLDL
jgi:hypothetical protein